MSDSEEPPAEEPPQQESGEDTLPVSQLPVDDVPTVVVGKKRAPRAKPVPAEPLEEAVEEAVPEVKVKPSRKAKAKAKARAPPAQVTEEPAPPPPSPKKARQRKTPTPPEQATAPLEAAPAREQWHPTRLLNDMNDFTVRIQELHRLNELRRKNMYRELIGGMV